VIKLERANLSLHRSQLLSLLEPSTLEDFFQGKEECAVVTVNETAVGTITWKDDFIMNLAVSPLYRKRGFGTALTVFAAQQCLLHHERALLETSNPAASRLYQRIGFQVNASYTDWCVRERLATTKA
jgi:ribosomal protein S18 acetylase RimI-like enzyme